MPTRDRREARQLRPVLGRLEEGVRKKLLDDLLEETLQPFIQLFGNRPARRLAEIGSHGEFSGHSRDRHRQCHPAVLARVAHEIRPRLFRQLRRQLHQTFQWQNLALK